MERFPKANPSLLDLPIWTVSQPQGESFESHLGSGNQGPAFLSVLEVLYLPSTLPVGTPFPTPQATQSFGRWRPVPRTHHPHLQLHCHRLPLWAPMTTSPGGLDVTHPTPTTSLSRQATLLHHTCGNRMFNDNNVGCLLQGPVHSRPSADTDSGRQLDLRVPSAWDSTVMILMKPLQPARRPIPCLSYE